MISRFLIAVPIAVALAVAVPNAALAEPQFDLVRMNQALEGLAAEDAGKESLRALEDLYISTLISSHQSSRILGGTRVIPGRYPWMAALVAENGSGQRAQFCGGFLVSDRHVVTAAHCNVVPLRALRVVLDSTEALNPNARSLPVTSFVAHQQYTSTINGYDIALITLKDAVDVPPVRMNDDPALPERASLGHVLGWGATAEGGSGSEWLLAATVPIVSRDDCSVAYALLPEGVICAGWQGGGIDTCQGDSGGPLLTEQDGQPPTVIGITSFGHGCGRPDFPGVYTSIAAHREWIGARVSRSESPTP